MDDSAEIETICTNLYQLVTDQYAIIEEIVQDRNPYVFDDNTSVPDHLTEPADIMRCQLKLNFDEQQLWRRLFHLKQLVTKKKLDERMYWTISQVTDNENKNQKIHKYFNKTTNQYWCKYEENDDVVELSYLDEIYKFVVENENNFELACFKIVSELLFFFF